MRVQTNMLAVQGDQLWRCQDEYTEGIKFREYFIALETFSSKMFKAFSISCIYYRLFELRKTPFDKYIQNCALLKETLLNAESR